MWITSRKHKIKEKQQQFMVNHIQSFKPQIPHHCREHAPNGLYLPSELTIMEMFSDYKDECQKIDEKVLKLYIL